MKYLTKFNEEGFRETSVAFGVHYTNDEEKKKYLDEGYVETSDEDYDYYVGNRGGRESGTGYIRDVATGKPVSAPPAPKAPPQEEETPPVDDGLVALAEAVAAHAERLAALEAAKGGEAK